MREHIYRVVHYRGKFEVRCCFLDSDGDIEVVDSEALMLSSNSIGAIRVMIESINQALKEPVLNLQYNSGYIEQKETKEDEN